MRKEVVLITGANGEIGHGLVEFLGKRDDVFIVGLDIQELDESLVPYCHHFVKGDILDNMLLGRLVAEFEIRTIYHLASILSTRAEFNPEAAHRVNVEGTLNLLRLAIEQAEWQGRTVKFIYPSSIAAYGLPDVKTKERAGKVKEEEWLRPVTMYGCNKLYCEHLGRYFARHYRQLGAEGVTRKVDFRALRFPGLISAVTVPTGGTSDFGPEMLHHAAQGEPYTCFVRPDACLPFMAMPDAIKALVDLWAADADDLSRLVYNVTSFSLRADDIHKIVREDFPEIKVNYEPDEQRQKIVDTWPADLDDSAAQREWSWRPDYDLDRAFDDYLIPTIAHRYVA
ncbi:MAG: NAD-dependent epimerase/dehydratase family protein [Anaerolineales bacterium]|nr:NAD-dependent epimerase/dehydratase family protein [Anaerolineales bacterium]